MFLLFLEAKVKLHSAKKQQCKKFLLFQATNVKKYSLIIPNKILILTFKAFC